MTSALWLLLRFRLRGRLRRLGRCMSTPRRMAMSMFALTLAVIWLGNAVLAVFLRDAYAPEDFRKWIPICLGIYAGWHLVRVAWKRPARAFEWTPAEESLVCSGPFSARQQVCYRLAIIFSAATFKALIASLMFLPEQKLLPVGFIGMLMALSYLEMLRVMVEVIAAGVTDWEYRRLRFAVLTAAAVTGGAAIRMMLRSWPDGENGDLPLVILLLQGFIGTLAEMGASPVGQILQLPFVTFREIIGAERPSLALAGWILLGGLHLAVATWLVLVLEQRLRLARVSDEQRDYSVEGARQTRRLVDEAATGGLSPVVHWRGPFTLAWRQSLGARKHASGVLLALIAPGLLACLPLLRRMSPTATYYNVVGGLAFYSFLLLPAALKFDFRRDYERLLLLKSLPARTSTIVLGQLMVPVAITWAFQLAVLAVVTLVRPMPPLTLIATGLAFIPLNIVIFGLDNLLFLLSPYRLHQEGLEVFLRTTLTFTAKGLIFGLILVAVFLWSQISRPIAEQFLAWGGMQQNPRVVFGAGLLWAITLASVAVVWFTARAFSRYDPSLDSGR
ncbi:hypothetical protein Mal4_10830 [Maioricimonas rarisocia]|uniref:Uncharacterized protein n=1 Tax=Maioricimonas rarisocia TaxID=2528026 RepID=A0A517Z2T5_9PLAN|nr:hypothetical protein [Maioricimonas rarisocia]QDU36785.1 hypothetical protein Mal4_10830 [Maioricimonas rarisocia]